MDNRGKEFEGQFKKDWKRTVGSFQYRLKDQMTGRKKTSANPCDYFLYKYPNMFAIECKSHEKNTFPFSKLTQYDDLIKLKDEEGLYAGVVLWLIDHDVVIAVHIEQIKKLKDAGKKSIHINDIKNKTFPFFLVPSEKKVVYMNSDYSTFV